LNNIAGVSGFEVKLVDNDDGTNLTGNSTFRVTATEAFGDFDIYSGSDISLEAQRQTFSGIAGVKQIDNMSLSPGSFTLVNNSTGETHEFTVTDTNDSAAELTSGTTGIHMDGKIDADELQNALNAITGVSGFTVHTKAAVSNTEPKLEFSTFTQSATQLGAGRVVRLTTSLGNIDVTATGTDMNALVADLKAHALYDSNVLHIENVSGKLRVSYVEAGDQTNIALANDASGTAAGTTAVTADTGATLTQAGVANDTSLDDEFIVHGGADFGDFDILSSGTTIFKASTGVTGDKNAFDVTLASGNSTNDTATVQGTVKLTSSSLFSVTQQDEYVNGNSTDVDEGANTTKDDSDAPNAATDMRTATGSLNNDNYFTTQAAVQQTVDNISLRSQVGASDAISVIDGAIEKVSSMRSSLGAIENRLDHTVSNLMNISEQTESARSRIQDADFAAESAKLSKAQVLKQAGVGMLAQANASSQLVLQLLQ
jgi:flagellin